jgi:tetratricopeptide (TPR) repeat protein
MKMKVFGFFVAIALLGAWIQPKITAQNTQAQVNPDVVSPTVVKAVLAEDWKQVADLLSDDICNKSPVARLIRGHACLALNRNNESLCLFLRTKAVDDLQQWLLWTGDLAARQPDIPVIHYLRADALARQKQWKQAIEAFDISIQLRPRAPLVLNARAVVHAALAEWDAAREDLVAAAEQDPLLSDLFASRGAYILGRATDPQRALEFYVQALKLSPDSILALNGRGCARIVLRQWEDARQDLELAVKLSSECSRELATISSFNLDTLVKMFNKASDDALARVVGIKPGMSITEKMDHIRSMPMGQQQLALDVLNNARNWNDRIAGNAMIPKVEIGIAGGIKGSMIGPQPFLEGKIGLSWDVRETSRFNLGHQTELLDAMKNNNPTLTPKPIDNFTAWTLQHIDSRYKFLAQPGGVSTKEIASEPAEAGNWNVVTVFGLLYDVARNEK